MDRVDRRDYEHALDSSLRLGLSADVRVSSAYVANPFPSSLALSIDRLPAYATLDSVLSLSAPTIIGRCR